MKHRKYYHITNHKYLANKVINQSITNSSNLMSNS